MELIGFTLDSAPVVQGAARMNSALDGTEKKIEETIKTAQKLGKELGAALKVQGTDTAQQKLLAGFQQLQFIAGSIGGAFQRAGSAISGGFTNAINQAGSALSGLKSAFTGAGSGGSSLLPILGGIAAGLAAVAAIGVVVGIGLAKTFLDLARQGSEIAGKMLDLSNNTGIATKSLLYYEIAAKQSGSSIDAVTSGIERFDRKLQDAASGDKKAAGLFQALGIDAKAAAEAPEKAFEQLAVRIASIEDPILRVKIATETLGKGGANLISTFITMKEEGLAIKTRMIELGLVFDNNVAKSADRIGDEFVVLGAVSDSLKVKIADVLAPQIVAGLVSIENSLARLAPAAVILGQVLISSFAPVTKLLEYLAKLVDKVVGGPSKVDPGRFNAASPSGQAAIQSQIRTESQGRKIDPVTGLPILAVPKRNPADQALEEFLASLKNKKGSSGGASDQGENALRDARIALAEAESAKLLQIEKASNDARQRFLDEALSVNLISIEKYYEERAKLIQDDAKLDIAVQQKKIDDQQKKIAEVEAGAASQLTKARKPAQREAISNRIEIEVDKSKKIIVDAQTKIAEINAKTTAAVNANSEAEIKKFKEIEQVVFGVRKEFLELNGQSFTAKIEEDTKKANEEIQKLLVNGKLIAALQAAQNRDVKNSRTRASGIGDKVADLRADADLVRVKIQNDVKLGVIGEGQAREEVLKLEEQLRGEIEGRLKQQLVLNKNDDKALAAINQQIEALRTLGKDEDALRERRAKGGFLNDPSFVNSAQKEAKDSRLKEAESTAKQIIDLQDQIAHASEDSANRYQVAWLKAELDVRTANDKAAQEFVANQVKIQHSLDVDPARLNDGVVRLIANQKTLQESLQDFRANTVQTAFDGISDGIDKLTEKFGVAGKALSQLLKDLAKLAVSKLLEKFLGIGSGATAAGFAGGGQQQSGGGLLGGLLGGGGGSQGGGGGLLGGLFGGGQSPGGGGGLLGSAFGGGGGQQSGGGGGLLGSIFGGGGQQSSGGGGGLLGKIFGGLGGGGKSGIDALQPTIGGDFGAGGAGLGGGGASGGLLGSLGGLGAGGLLAGGGLLGSLAGGKSPTGKLLGGLGGTLLGGVLGASGIFGGGIAAALPALFSNPITAIIGGALIGGALLFNFFAGREQRKFRKTVEDTYALKVDGKAGGTALYKSIKALGEEHFGKGKFGKKILDTIRLEKAQEQLAAYGESTGQANNPLVKKFKDTKELVDPGDPRNQFVKRAFGGTVTAGQPYIVGDGGRSEVFRPNTHGQIFPSLQSFMMDALRSQVSAPSYAAPSSPNSGGDSPVNKMLLGVLDRIHGSLDRIDSMSPEQVVTIGARRAPDAIGEANLRSIRSGSAVGLAQKNEVYKGR